MELLKYIVELLAGYTISEKICDLFSDILKDFNIRLKLKLDDAEGSKSNTTTTASNDRNDLLTTQNYHSTL